MEEGDVVIRKNLRVSLLPSALVLTCIYTIALESGFNSQTNYYFAGSIGSFARISLTAVTFS